MKGMQRLKGETKQGEKPEWRPLLNLVGEDGVDQFMWMFEVTLSDESDLHAYKHIETRRYLHLDSKGRAFAYEEADRYRQIAVLDLAALVLPGLRYDLWPL